MSALCWTAEKGHEELLKLLVSSGANVNLADVTDKLNAYLLRQSLIPRGVMWF